MNIESVDCQNEIENLVSYKLCFVLSWCIPFYDVIIM